MSTVVVTIKTSKDPQEFRKTGQRSQNLTNLENLIKAFKAGAALGAVFVQSSTVDPVSASGTFTLTSAIATDAITIGAVTMTATSTPSLATDWEIDGVDNAADAAALAAAINANPTLSKVVVATSLAAVVTVAALQKGLVGNQIPISSADATIVASGAFLTGGTGGATDAPIQVR